MIRKINRKLALLSFLSLVQSFQVKGITNADDGKTLDGTFTDSDSAEKGWMLSIANTQSPIC